MQLVLPPLRPHPHPSTPPPSQICTPMLAQSAGPHDDAVSEAAHTCGLGGRGDGSTDATTTEEVALAAAEAYACLYRPTAGVGDGSGHDGPAHVFSLTLSALGAAFPLLVAEATTAAPVASAAAAAARASAAAVLTRLATVAAAGLAALSLGGAPAAHSHSGGGGGASESKGDAGEAAAAPRLRWAAADASEVAAAGGGAEEGAAGGDELAARTLLATQLLWEALAALPAAAPEPAVAAVVATARPALAVVWGVTLQVAAAAASGAGAAEAEGKEGEGGLPAGLFADDEALVEAAAQLRDALEMRLAPQAPPAYEE